MFIFKFICKKSITFVKLKKQNVECAHEISWFTKKVVYVQKTMVFGISALIADAIFVENIFYSKSESAYISAFFNKKIY